MKITINIEKRHAYVIIGLLVVIAGIFAVNAFTDSSGVGHGPGQIGPGTFGGKSNQEHEFPGGVIVKKNLRVNGVGKFHGSFAVPDYKGQSSDNSPSPVGPPSGSCNQFTVGRMYVDTSNDENTRLMLCEGSPGGDGGTWQRVN
jgi:hypothetical protein